MRRKQSARRQSGVSWYCIHCSTSVWANDNHSVQRLQSRNAWMRLCEYTDCFYCPNTGNTKKKESEEKNFLFEKGDHVQFLQSQTWKYDDTIPKVTLAKVCVTVGLLLLRLAKSENQDFDWTERSANVGFSLVFLEKTCAALLSVKTTTKCTT